MSENKKKIKTVIFDTETTGLPKPMATTDLKDQPKIIELGIVVVEGEEVVGNHNWLIWPEEQISAEITKITGIKNEDLVGCKTFQEIVDEVVAVFAGAEYAVAHNMQFDRSLLTLELRRINATGRSTGFKFPPNCICSVQEYHHLFGHRPTLKKLYEKATGSPLAQTHRASDDAFALYESLLALGFFKDICEV